MPSEGQRKPSEESPSEHSLLMCSQCVGDERLKRDTIGQLGKVVFWWRTVTMEQMSNGFGASVGKHVARCGVLCCRVEGCLPRLPVM